ncbi:3-isopropylmalate dehydratase large subunit [Desulfovibrio desulfuricans]|uniref:3-isopropylmalate dehydratase large subunit n=1 Tax=uncultured Desulfovibrio sp. TaxID=167968 RepID=A0A212K249_9BACT|nr:MULTISPECIES: 3-isopropylmalate dehydratase large subunit [Desulfovibrio]MBD8896045.1 3-isopropylmalate dehydratase large subunit [Desulfovibrio desulfuricans]MCB6541275.1 3-isopropylmalate dehydratase large subunit [Desulfovibrio desulfuricans]MCB6552357.1 3-isopropylmalate dehydratase large subunit [Desulfovibrio desulfuricans]MCB6564200.1 3-isopropylmalate dehydratase large subunit [Desulfovibrio desulfuricans]MCB7345380.1 3-isopropylmalate dehydratase large subunit [Desulfovibrio desulf
MPQTLAQKILQAHTDEVVEQDGQIVQCRVSLVLANDITGPLAIKSFKGMGAEKVFDKDKIALVMDHFTPQKDIDSANQVMVTRKFAEEQNITHYYEGGDCGVEHTLLPEQGLVGPGDVVIGADSHTCTYGGIGAFATGMGSTDIAAAMALGETWFKVPSTIRVNIDGQMPKWLRGKDLMLMLIGAIGVDGALYKALEFGGSVVDDLSVEGRLCMANMAIEAGGKVGLFAVDAKTRAYCAEHKRPGLTQDLAADPGAVYERVVNIDVTGKEPVVACPHLPSNVKPVSEVRNTPIQQVVIGSCTNGRISDMRDAAEVLRGRKVAKHLRCIVLPSTPTVWKQCLKEGLIETFMESGCVVGPCTCGPCLGGHMGILGDGERAVATTNRNFKGRMGSLSSEVYLASPIVAAASAIAGCVAGPDQL